MFTKYSRLKFRRKFRARKKSVKQSADEANKNIERHLFRRNHNWPKARRFVYGWTALLVLLGFGVTLQIRGLGNTYQTIEPTAGGVYSEGIVGNLQNANPIYTTTTVDNAVSSLVFSSLLSYNKQNKLVGELAKSWEADANAKAFTVKLKDNVYWHDGEKLDANDVVFTYNTIRNPDSQSNLFSTWRSVRVQKIDDLTLKFTLPNAFSPFPHLLTNGILPEHKLNGVDPSQLRADEFNNNPVGTGPFKWSDVEVENLQDEKIETVQLINNEGYFKGEPQLNGFNIKTYPDRELLESALLSKEIDAAAGTDYLQEIGDNINTSLYNQTSQLMLFINTQRPSTSDKNVRKALIKATNVTKVSDHLPYVTVPVDEPILRSQLGYNKEFRQLAYSPDEVDKILTDAGWTWNEGQQYRTKEDKQLTLSLVTENTPDYAKFAEEIQNQWAEFGVKANVILEDPDEILTNSLDNKEYDALLYSINIGADPDSYVYWHSSQAEDDATPGFNFSRYKSETSDAALEAGRSRVDAKLRAEKYKPFLSAWKEDVPAIGIHQPVFLYTTRIKVYNQDAFTINNPAERYKNVHNWQINTTKTTVQR